MKKLLIVPMSLCLLACSHSRLVSDPVAKADFEARRDSLNAPQYFEIFQEPMSDDVRAGLEFLYAYMPLSDITDYSGEYFRDNVEIALRTRDEMPWGGTVPDREFKHFVLPIRVNNENLDGHRAVFYDELKERVKGMTMSEAILEVNHWCHEHATYQPSDARTHSPLATVSSAIGRCGEESTFTVAALRSIGIPARQVYTPRWAHTDDNHAWVEAWADGQWHFLGACEPEAVLDLGWFNAPASRGMLMNTRAIGRYDGPEEKLLEMPTYTDINVTANYAPVDTLVVTVVDAGGNPLEGATVKFCLYNYAEFFPIATKIADAQGQASLVAGLGDLIVWAAHDGNFAIAKATVGTDQDIKVTIDENNVPTAVMTWDIVPPAGGTVIPEVSAEMAAENDRRKAREDSIRNAYVATFVDDSRGNRAVLDAFLNSLPDVAKADGYALLDNLTQKDLTDVTLDVLNDAMLVPQVDTPLYHKYVLSPRIEMEHLQPFRQHFANVFDESQKQAFRDNPAIWAKWVLDSISTDMVWQPSTVRMAPWSVWTLRRTNVPSRNVFFVAAARAMGIPARIDPVTEKPQYADAKGNWHDMAASEPTNANVGKGALKLTFQKDGFVTDPGYYFHFTISKIDNGEPQLLNYDEGDTWSNAFAKAQSLDEGRYMLISGQRQADGSVLARAEFFDVVPGATTTVPLVLRQDSEGVKVIGNFDSESKYHNIAEDTDKSILSTTGRGYYVLGLVKNNNEPSNHALRDISAMAAEFEADGIPMIILFPTVDEANSCTLTADLPKNATLGADIDNAIQHSIAEALDLGSYNLPVFIIADTFNRVVFLSEGYTIGLGNQLLRTSAKLR